MGTKRQARELVKNTAEGLGVLFMANRWLGGTLTNFQTMKKRIDREAGITTDGIKAYFKPPNGSENHPAMPNGRGPAGRPPGQAVRVRG